MPDKELFEFDCFRLDPAEHLLLRDGEPVPLEPKVFETLLVLIRRDKRLVGKEELMQAVWPDSFVEESNLTRNISVLRKALNRNDGGPQYIETVPKRGYRFVGEVRAPAGERAELIVQLAKVSVVVEEEECDGETKGEGESTREEEPGTAIEWKQRSFGKTKRHKVGLALTLMLSVAAALYFNSFGGGGQAIDSLVVLPFVNVGADPDAEYLSDGVTDSLINDLSQLPGLRVMSRNSVFRYKGREVNAQQAGQTLGVRAVLTGKVTRRGNDLLVTAELVDVRDNSHLWGGQYNRKLSDLLAVQAELARDISQQLRLKLSSQAEQRLTKRDTENPEAYELYLKGRYALNTLREQQQYSSEYFQRASEKDPRFALAYAGLAESYAEMGNLSTTFILPPKEAYSRAKAAALKAVELDDTLAEAHVSLGKVAMNYEWDWPGVEREFKRAIALNPNYLNAHHWYSHYLILMGRFDESLAESRLASALDPLDVGMTYHLGFHYYNARHYDQAIAQLQKALKMDPTHNDVHAILGLVYKQTGRYQEAIAELQEGMKLGGRDDRGLLGHAYAISGQQGEARKILAQLQEEARHKSVSPYNIARLHMGLGEKEQAFAWLEKAFAERDGNFTNPGLKVDHVFDHLHSDPRFADLLRRAGLPQ